MKKKVVILGGGVAGMSAAHELAERGFDVAVYEARPDIPGGKARSIPVPNSSVGGRKSLPGEHGFRFFPGFYQHITDTMKRIPYKNNTQGVFSNLVEATQLSIPRFDRKGLTLPAKVPTTISDVQLLVNAFCQLISGQSDLEEGELKFFAQKIWQLVTSSKERRVGEYEKVDWWTFVEADRFSPAYQSLLAKGLTESLVASKAKLASTKTVGDIFLQLLFDLINPTISTDRLLNGPTNEVWIDPWLRHLEVLGVNYYFSSQITSIEVDPATYKVQSVTIKNLTTSQLHKVTGDFYIAAVPVEVMADLIVNSKLEHYDPTFKSIRDLARNVAWMNGIQFYLKEDVPVAHGHVLLVDTPWALTAISQKQFWANVDLSDYGDGQVKGILSVDISNWGPFPFSDLKESQVHLKRSLEGNEGLGIIYGKYAKDCTDEEIKHEVWEQLKRSLNVDGQEILKDENLYKYFLDNDIVDPEKRIFQWITLPTVEQVTLNEVQEFCHLSKQEAEKHLRSLIDLGYVKRSDTENEETTYYQSTFNISNRINLEPLLVNLVNTWQLRPDAFTKIPNLFLASDYVRTNTDLATMEGANEAARRAVNAIIEASGQPLPLCKIWELHEPEIFAPLRWHDSIRYQQGLPWEDIFHFKAF